jgi:phosphatidylglycerophosphatase A
MMNTYLERLVYYLAIGFGAGRLPKAPGTYGTLVGVLIYLPLSLLSLPLYLMITASLILVGIGICGYAARQLGKHDHPSIVWDEIAGLLVTMIAAPQGIGWVILGFALFRCFDIFKPWPINRIDQKVSGGLGIMLDDIAAGIAAGLSLQLIAYSINFIE